MTDKPTDRLTLARKAGEEALKSSSEPVHASMAEADQDFRYATSHAAQDHSKQNEIMSDAEFLSRVRGAGFSPAGMDVPELEGFHVCWIPANSENPNDRMETRMRLGYSVVKPEEIPTFVSRSNSSANHEGCVSQKEMILVKIPERLYQLYMRDAHHTQPFEQEQNIKSRVRSQFIDHKTGESTLRDEHEMTGFNSLARKVAVPKF